MDYVVFEFRRSFKYNPSAICQIPYDLFCSRFFIGIESAGNPLGFSAWIAEESIGVSVKEAPLDGCGAYPVGHSLHRR